MTLYDFLFGSAHPIHRIWDGLGGNLLVFRGESEVITTVKKGADQSAPEFEVELYLKRYQKGGQCEE
jgi:hypothetical protein